MPKHAEPPVLPYPTHVAACTTQLDHLVVIQRDFNLANEHARNKQSQQHCFTQRLRYGLYKERCAAGWD